MSDILDRLYLTTLPNGDQLAVPVRVIAENRAKHYLFRYAGSMEASLLETAACFGWDDYEIEDWARNNMNWEDVEPHSFRYRKGDRKTNLQESWVSGDHEVVEDNR